jgi:hypothetical protein
LLPDPAFPLVYQSNGPGIGQIDPRQPLAANRLIPIEAAPEYTEGKLALCFPNASFQAVPYPVGINVPYPVGVNSNLTQNVLMVKEMVVESTGLLNAPTSWFWNIRVGDKLQINGAGLWYTVVGPMVVTPAGGNSELYVNVGLPGTVWNFQDQQGSTANPVMVNPEFLFLVNGLDDNGNGWVDEGWDGVNNNLNQELLNGLPQLTDDIVEWEPETWPATVLASALSSQQYTIQRRPAPAPNSREVSLPTNVVIDMTTSGGLTLPSGLIMPQERSQIPPGVINPYTGYVDILVYPNGTIVPTTIYSTPSSYGMSGAFFNLWLAERSDVTGPQLDNNGNPVPLVAGQPVFLPVGNIRQQLINPATPYSGPSLKGEYRIVTLFTRTGQITTNDNPQFDNPVNPANQVTLVYNPGYPFLATQQGSRGGQ